MVMLLLLLMLLQVMLIPIPILLLLLLLLMPILILRGVKSACTYGRAPFQCQCSCLRLLTHSLTHSRTQHTQGYRVGCRFPGKYKIVLDSDWAEFGGHERNDRHNIFFSSDMGADGRPHSFQVRALTGRERGDER